MSPTLILASTSAIRARLLTGAGVAFQTQAARIDEESITAAMLAEGAKPRDVADALAEFKARKVADKNPDSMVIGCDQVLELKGRLLGKPTSPDCAKSQLRDLSGETHQLLSATVIYEAGKPVWRTVGSVQMQMRPLTDAYIQAYVDRNWPGIRETVGCYKLEEEGSRLFTRIQGDYFAVLGLPLLEVLSYLTLRGILQS